MNTEHLAATAHHEAGHAVAAWRQAIAFKYVTIAADPKAGSLGHIVHRPAKWFHPDSDSSDRTILRAQRRIVVALAGQIAERKFYGRRPQYGMEADNRNAVDMAGYLCGSEKTTNAFLRYCWCATEDLVEANWKNITAVAAALLERQTLRRLDVIAAIRAANGRGK